MDITLDVGELYFGLNSALKLEEDLIALSNAMNSVTVSSELPSASTFNSMKTTLSSTISTDVDDLIVRLENSKRILQENDEEAAMLFTFFDNGIINGDFEFTDMPLLDQTDYNNIKYSQGTVATSGCGITSVCMVASYFTGKLYTPEDLAAMANKSGTSNVDRMTWAADYVGLNWYCNENTSTDDLKQMLNEGKVVICLVKNSSHFVVCKGITDDGMILVNDPYGPWAKDEPYSLSDLKMSCGKTWVFDPAQNQHLSGQVDTDVNVEANVVEMLQNENGFTDRNSTPGEGAFVDDGVGSTEPITNPNTTPSMGPSSSPSTSPSTTLSSSPSTSPSTTPNSSPSTSLSTAPSSSPSTSPTTTPSSSPSTSPSTTPSSSPSTSPSTTPSTRPSPSPNTTPTTIPSTSPIVENPTVPATEIVTSPVESVPPVIETEPVVGGEIIDGSSSVEDTLVDNNMSDSMSDNSSSDLYDDINTNDDYINNYDDFPMTDNDYYSEVTTESPVITTTTTSKTDYSKYVVPGIVGTALVGGAAATYGVLKNKDKNKDKDDDDGDISLSEF